MSICVIGTVFVDIKGFPEDKYIPGGRNAGNIVTVHGGVSRNVAEDIANVELRPTFVSLVDDTPQGEEVLKKLRAHKVNTDYVRSVPDGMGIWLAVFNEAGDVVASISKRPDPTALLELIKEKGDEIFRDCDSIVIEFDIDKELIKTVLAFAEKYGKKVYALVANMSIAMHRRDFLRRIDCFVCNLEEAELLFVKKLEGLSTDELRTELVSCIESAGIPAMVVTLGALGSVYASLDGESGHCPAEDVDVRDTTGAGDSFCAGLTIGLTYGKSLCDAVKIGTRLAASVIQSYENVCPRFQPMELGIEIP
ncbi:MAG: carbohydrate kinase family protein [Eubacteriales bacterium]|nr:carbohydrate kinase family protein [Eubacteriales bacterium]